MKRKIINILLSLFIMFSFPIIVFADLTGFADNTRVRTCPVADNELCPAIKDEDETDAIVSGEVVILDTVKSDNPERDNCSSKEWYKISYHDQEGYICSSYVTLKSEEKEEVIPTSSISSKYEVVAYATHPDDGRVAVVSLKEGMEDEFVCDVKRILVDNKLKCVNDEVLTNYQTVVVFNTDEIAYNYEEELAKFPTSYHEYLNKIHERHPNWRFYAYDTNLDWNEVVSKEKNSSLIDSAVINESYFDVSEGVNYNWRTNTYIYHEAGRWVTPSMQATAYYVDPRTYLQMNYGLIGGIDEYKDIFVFEDARAYTYQNVASVEKILDNGGANTSFMTSEGEKSYKQAFMDGSTFSKISPLILIARARSETSNFKSNSVSGNYCNDETGECFQDYYNYFNVGAFGTYPVTSGLRYAKAAGWNDRYKAIVEGSIFIGTKYIYNGQETQYFQKFNVSPETPYEKFSHQYQTNISAPQTEGGYVFWGYEDSGNIDLPIVFHIPVYLNMKDEITPKPKNGNPNNWLLDLKVDGNTLTGFDGDNYYSYNNNWDNEEDDVYENNIYTYNVAWNQDEINIEAIKANDKARVDGIGKILAKESKTIYIKVTAENETTKTYAINLVKQEAPSLGEDGNPLYPAISEILDGVGIKYTDKYMSGLAMGTSYQSFIDAVTKNNSYAEVAITKNSNNKTDSFATGDIIKIKSGDVEESFMYILYGDLNGDCKIDIFDLVDVRNIILNVSNLTEDYRKAGDINRDNKVDIFDLVDVRNSILGTPIQQ